MRHFQWRHTGTGSKPIQMYRAPNYIGEKRALLPIDPDSRPTESLLNFETLALLQLWIHTHRLLYCTHDFSVTPSSSPRIHRNPSNATLNGTELLLLVLRARRETYAGGLHVLTYLHTHTRIGGWVGLAVRTPVACISCVQCRSRILGFCSSPTGYTLTWE